MKCDFKDFVFGASNASRQHTRTILAVRGLDPARKDDRAALEQLACDAEVKALLDRRRLKFRAPAGWQVARGIEQGTLDHGTREDCCYRPPLKVMGQVARAEVDRWFAIEQQQSSQGKCGAEDIELLPFERGFRKDGLHSLARLDLRFGEVQQVVLRVSEKSDPDALYVARIDHWAESSNPEKQVKRGAAQNSGGAAYKDSKHAERIGGMWALFVTPHDPF